MLYFEADDGVNGIELWKSDGTSFGTTLVKDIRAGNLSAIPRNLTNVNGTHYFRANDGANGFELWKSDGTAAGTVMIKDIRSGVADGYPFWLTNVNGTLYFNANNGINGYEFMEVRWNSCGNGHGQGHQEWCLRRISLLAH